MDRLPARQDSSERTLPALKVREQLRHQLERHGARRSDRFWLDGSERDEERTGGTGLGHRLGQRTRQNGVAIERRTQTTGMFMQQVELSDTTRDGPKTLVPGPAAVTTPLRRTARSLI